MLTIHDCDVYAYSVSIPNGRIVLSTNCPSDAPAYIDVVFSDVGAAQFDALNFHTKQNILYGIYEVEPAKLFREFASFFAPKTSYGSVLGYEWLPFTYKTEDEFIARLNETDLRCFDVQSSVGLNGFVMAKSYELIVRADRAPDA